MKKQQPDTPREVLEANTGHNEAVRLLEEARQHIVSAQELLVDHHYHDAHHAAHAAWEILSKVDYRLMDLSE